MNCFRSVWIFGLITTGLAMAGCGDESDIVGVTENESTEQAVSLPSNLIEACESHASFCESAVRHFNNIDYDICMIYWGCPLQ